MSHHWKSPRMVGGQDALSPVSNSTPRHGSPKSWCSSPPHWQHNNRTPSQGSRSPHFNQYHSPRGYWGSPWQWSPNRWEQSPSCQRSWGSSPRTPQYSPQYKHSPEHGSAYNIKDGRAQSSFKQNRAREKDISIYYRPSMVADPWAELQAKPAESTSTSF